LYKINSDALSEPGDVRDLKVSLKTIINSNDPTMGPNPTAVANRIMMRIRWVLVSKDYHVVLPAKNGEYHLL